MSRAKSNLKATSIAPVFAALGDPTRLALLSQLGNGQPRSVTQLTHGSALTRQGVSKHLRVLERAGLVDCRRLGRESLYVLQPASLVQARHYLDRVSEQWNEAISRLKELVEG